MCVQKFLGPTNFWSKLIFVQKFLVKKNCFIIEFWIQDNFGPKLLDPKRILGPRYFWVQIILDPITLGLTKWWSQKKF